MHLMDDKEKRKEKNQYVFIALIDHIGFQVLVAGINSFNARMANVSRKICDVMATLLVPMIRMKIIVNVPPISSLVWMENVFQHQLYVTVEMTALMGMMKITAVSKSAFAIHFLILNFIKVKPTICHSHLCMLSSIST